MPSRTFLDALVEALRDARQFNQNDQVPPAAILWPDEDRQWQALLPQLRPRLPLLTLGEYDPENRVGPAYWLRCMIARTLPDDLLPEDAVPIIYLPGYGKQDLRAIEECPKPLQPLAELQYRGTLWLHRNGRDWTVAGFLHSLDVAVAADSATKEALARALPKLAAEPLAALRRAAPLRADFFNQLLHPDAVRQLLLWLDDPEGFKKQATTAEWKAFADLCRQRYGFHPDKDGPISAAARLGGRSSDWAPVWQRFVEAPEAYPNVPALLRQARPQQLGIFESAGEAWPQDNETAEARLRTALAGLRDLVPAEARAAILQLDQEHGPRRHWVWARLGQAPLAQALAHLVSLAQLTQQSLGGATVAQIAEAYTDWGWQVDAAVLQALAAVSSAADANAVKVAILPLYRPWLAQAAGQMQRLVVADPANHYQVDPPPRLEPGTCLLFSDALRFDVGRQLVATLERDGYECATGWRLAALPPVTPTAKAAVSPVAGMIAGGQPGLTPIARESGTSLNAGLLRRLISSAGHQVLQGSELGDPAGTAWTEFGALDRYGHDHGWKIARHVAAEVRALAERVTSLLEHGWRRVIVVTDHGWLMLPYGLPKVDLPQHLTLTRKGRCAVLKEGAATGQQTVPWYWDPHVRIAIAPDLHCYEAGKEYEHGGISPQECVTAVITVRQATGAAVAVSIGDVIWRGLRCYVTLSGATPDVTVDIRAKAADPATSLAAAPKAPDETGSVSLIVPDEAHEGEAAFVVVMQDSELRAQQLTMVGGS